MGESSFWYRPTRVVPDQRPLNGRRCCCVVAAHSGNLLHLCMQAVHFFIRFSMLRQQYDGMTLMRE